ACSSPAASDCGPEPPARIARPPSPTGAAAALHNSVTDAVHCEAAGFEHAARRQAAPGPGGAEDLAFERTRPSRERISRLGSQRGLSPPQLLSAVALVLAGHDQGGVSRTRQH